VAPALVHFVPEIVAAMEGLSPKLRAVRAKQVIARLIRRNLANTLKKVNINSVKSRQLQGVALASRLSAQIHDVLLVWK
jgi:hypothetical protein